MPSARLNLAYIEYDQKNFLSAATRFKELLKMNGDNPDAIYGLALSYYSQGDKQLARREFQRYLEIVPSGAWATKARSFLAKM